MWPLFSPRWIAWRTQLGLPPTPMLTFAGEAKLPARTPLLYGFSETVVPVPGYWPTSVHTCGFWSWPDAMLELVKALPRAVERWLDEAAPNQPLVVSLGMLADAGLVNRPKELCVNLLGMATAAAVSLIVMLPADPANSFTRAWEHLCDATATTVATESSSGRQSHGWQSDGGGERRTVAHPSGALGVVGSVPFERLLPRCAAVMHHGGSGTTAAALRAGIPQVRGSCWQAAFVCRDEAKSSLIEKNVADENKPHGRCSISLELEILSSYPPLNLRVVLACVAGDLSMGVRSALLGRTNGMAGRGKPARSTQHTRLFESGPHCGGGVVARGAVAPSGSTGNAGGAHTTRGGRCGSRAECTGG